MSVLVDVVVMKDMDLLVNRLNEFNMPGDLFNQTIHDNCERRGHFENGEFVYEFGSKEEEMGYCLYPVGCKGPQTRAPVSYTHLWWPSPISGRPSIWRPTCARCFCTSSFPKRRP